MPKKDEYTTKAVEIIEELMKAQGVTPGELAKRAEVTPSYVTQALSYKYKTSVPPETYESFANAMDATLTSNVRVFVSITSSPLPEGTGKLKPKRGGKKKDA